MEKNRNLSLLQSLSRWQLSFLIVILKLDFFNDKKLCLKYNYRVVTRYVGSGIKGVGSGIRSLGSGIKGIESAAKSGINTTMDISKEDLKSRDRNFLCNPHRVEIFEDLADVDSVFVAVGGGGLIGGIAAYLKSVKPGIKVKGLNEEGKWTFFLNVHRMIHESHATLLVGFSITAGYRRPTAACKNSYHRLLSLQSGSSVWILPCSFFFRAQTPITPSAASGKIYWNQNFCIGWKNMKVAWEYLAETYLHVKLIVKLPCHNNVCTENTKHVKSLRSAAVAAIVFPPKWSTKITLTLMRARVLSSSTVKQPRMCFFFFARVCFLVWTQQSNPE